MVAGFFFKQTAAIAAAVTAVVLVLRSSRPSRADLLTALFPLAVMSAVILGLRVFQPTGCSGSRPCWR